MDTPRELEEMSKGTIKADASALKGFDDGEKRNYLAEAFKIATGKTMLLPQQEHVVTLVSELLKVIALANELRGILSESPDDDPLTEYRNDEINAIKKMVKKL